MIDHYADLRGLHLLAVGLSVGLFTLRAVAVLAGARWPLARPVRVASWGIDSTLLTAGALLWAALQIHPVQQLWLGTKLLLLLVYIGLGTMALRRARSTRARLGWTLAALACFGFMVSVARAHHPLGWWAV